MTADLNLADQLLQKDVLDILVALRAGQWMAVMDLWVQLNRDSPLCVKPGQVRRVIDATAQIERDDGRIARVRLSYEAWLAARPDDEPAPRRSAFDGLTVRGVD